MVLKEKSLVKIDSNKLDLLLKKIIFWAFNLLLIVTPFIFTWFNEELFEFNKMIFVYLMTVIIGTAWVARMVTHQKVLFKHTPLDWPLSAFILTQLIATIFSIHPRTSIFGYYTRFHGGLLSTLTYSILYWAFISNFKLKHIRLLLRNSLLAAIAISLYAIPERLGVSPSCIIIRGKFNVNCWVQDVQHRVFATFGQPNWLAAYLITLIPIAGAYYLQQLQTAKKFISKTKASWWFLGLSLMFLALIFTQSRSGILGLGIGLVLFLALNIKISYSNKKTNIVKPIPTLLKNTAILLFFFSCLILIIGTDFTPSIKQVWRKISSLAETSESHSTEDIDLSPTETRSTDNPNIIITPSEKIRYIVWKGAIKIWRRYPLFGSGPGTFAYSYYLDRPLEHNLVSEWDFLYNKAHNELLNILATSGLFGLITYLWLLVTIFYHGWKLINNSNTTLDNKILTSSILAGLLSLGVSNLLGFSTVMVSVLMMILSATLYSLNKTDLKIKKISGRLSLFQVLTLSLLTLIGFHLAFNVVRIWQADYYLTQGKNNLNNNEYERGLSYLKRAVILSPQEALYYDELSSANADIAARLVAADATETAKEFAALAIEASDKTIRLNAQHLNFYKTRASVYSKLSALDQSYLHDAQETLILAQQLAPTDPKLVYQEGLVAHSLGNTDEAISLIEQAIEMKPNYHQARYKLGQIYEEQKNYPEALEQYRFIRDYLIPQDLNLKQKIEALEAALER